jgi:hypothetical protein
MTFLMALYVLNTIVFLWPIWKQFKNIYESPINDEHIIYKTEVLIVSLSMLSAMWLSYFNVKYAAWFFFMVAIFVRAHKYSKK